MALETFPTYLSLRRKDFKPVPVSQALRSPMESGLAAQRNLQTRRTKQYRCPYLIESKANFSSWETWFFSTVNQTDWFTWTDPISGSSVTARIVANSYDGGTPLNNALSVWVITFTVEYYE